MRNKKRLAVKRVAKRKNRGYKRKQKGGFGGLFGLVDKIVTAPLRIANFAGKQMKYRQYYKKHNQRGGVFGFGSTYQPTDVTKFKDIKYLAKYFK